MCKMLQEYIYNFKTAWWVNTRWGAWNCPSRPFNMLHAEDVCTELRIKWHKNSNPSLFWLLSISQQFQWIHLAIFFMTGHLVSESKWAVQHILYTMFIEFESGWFSYQRRFVWRDRLDLRHSKAGAQGKENNILPIHFS